MVTSSQTLHEVLHEVNTDPDKFTVPKNAPSGPLLSTQHPNEHLTNCACPNTQFLQLNYNFSPLSAY